MHRKLRLEQKIKNKEDFEQADSQKNKKRLCAIYIMSSFLFILYTGSLCVWVCVYLKAQTR